jgi:hypothetical protein
VGLVDVEPHIGEGSANAPIFFWEFTTMKIALLLALALATPAKDDTPPQDDIYIALTTTQCGKTRGVIWIRMDGKDFYVTGETRVNGTLPRLSGNYVLNGDELTRNGKPCKGVTSKLLPDEVKSDAAMLEDRFGLPVFQLGPDNRAEWSVCRILLKDKSIGEIVMPAGDQSKRCNSMFPSRRPAAIEHSWYVANGVPYCVYEDTSGNALGQIPPPEGFTCQPWGQIMQRLKKR